MKKIIFYIKQLFPFTYYSKYKKEDGKTELAIWRQWFCIPFHIQRFEVVD